MEEVSLPSSNRKNKLHVCLWRPQQRSPLAILQIVHGMAEYIERYADFAEFLTQQGILVVGHDHLGHGQSVTDSTEYGHSIADFQTVITDVGKVRQFVQIEFPEVPFFVLGHSMGSFITQAYLKEAGEQLTGAIISGTGYQSPVKLSVGLLTTQILMWLKGEAYQSTLVDKTAFGGYNKAFEPAQTPKDWLTRDAKEVAAYLADERTQFTFSVAAYHGLFALIKAIYRPKQIQKLSPAVPLLFVAGQADPVGDFGKGVDQVVARYRKYRGGEICQKMYPDYRHELLNELEKEQVYQDILTWMKQHLSN